MTALPGTGSAPSSDGGGSAPGGTPPALHAIPWYRAATIPERLPVPARATTEAGTRTQRRIARWLAHAGTSGSEPFVPVLRTVGLTETTLPLMLAEDDATLANRLAVPAWLRELVAHTSTQPVPRIGGEQPGLFAFAAPIVGGYARALRRTVSSLVERSGETRLDRLPALLSEQPPDEELASALGRTLVLELNVARMRGELVGTTPEARFRDFCRRLCDPARTLAFWDEYPVLLRYLRDVLHGWLDSGVEFARRLIEDLPRLSDRHRAPLGNLTGVRFGSGDRHRTGRSVAIVHFGDAAIVYKPRSMAGDLAWQQVLRWYNTTRPPYRLAGQWVIDRGGYGWMEYVASRPYPAPEAAPFSWRLGALLALQYALRGVDLHVENVIVAADQPVLVDLETVLHPDPPDEPDPRSDGPAERLLRTGVTAIGLLPSRVVVREAGEARMVDLSALGMVDGQQSPFPVPVPRAAGTDEMRFVDGHPVVRLPPDNALWANGAGADVRRHIDELCDGFSWTYRRLVADSVTWLRTGGLLDAFADAPLRYVARSTMFYSQLRSDSLHPDFLRDGVDRAGCLMRLARGAAGRYRWERLVHHELADLTAGDIPYFEFRPAGRDLCDSRGARITDFFPAPPIEAARARIRYLDDADLLRQRYLIRNTVAGTFGEPASRAAPVPGGRTALPANASGPTGEAVTTLASRLCDTAVHDRDEVGWLAIGLADERFWQLSPAGMDLYAGLPGIGLFLAAVTRHGTEDDRVTDVSHRAAETIRRRACGLADTVREAGTRGGPHLDRLLDQANAGVHGTVAGPAYYLSHASTLLGRPDLRDAAEALMPALAACVERDGDYDLVGGAAGAILAALAVHAIRPHGPALSVACRAGDLLCRAAQPQRHGVAWPSRLGGRPLAGASHGASGIALALARLYAVVPRPGYAATVSGALRFERSLFDGSAGDWPDLRDAAPARFMSAWCHGAPGIGLIRWELLRTGTAGLHPDGVAAVEQELAWAVAGTRRAFGLPAEPLGLPGEPFGLPAEPDAAPTSVRTCGQDGLCHGDLGNLELLRLDAEWRGDRAARLVVDRVVAAIRTRAATGGWRTGVPGTDEPPGLMYGQAGIGYQLLRLADPAGTPSVLLLHPPAGTVAETDVTNS